MNSLSTIFSSSPYRLGEPPRARGTERRLADEPDECLRGALDHSAPLDKSLVFARLVAVRIDPLEIATVQRFGRRLARRVLQPPGE